MDANWWTVANTFDPNNLAALVILDQSLNRPSPHTFVSAFRNTRLRTYGSSHNQGLLCLGESNMKRFLLNLTTLKSTLPVSIGWTTTSLGLRKGVAGSHVMSSDFSRG